jgi:acyl carrier protein
VSIEARIKALLATQLGVKEDEIQQEKKLGEDLGADSLDCIEVVLAAEDEFSITITDEEAEKVTTVAELISLVTSKGTT